MRPTAHKVAGAKKGSAETPLAIGAPSGSATRPASVAQALQHARTLPAMTADGLVAVVAFAANQALAGQVQLVHGAGRFARAHSQVLASAGEATPAGPVREAFGIAARVQAKVADVLSQAALRWGRSFGRLAFAFPVPDRRR